MQLLISGKIILIAKNEISYQEGKDLLQIKTALKFKPQPILYFDEEKFIIETQCKCGYYMKPWESLGEMEVKCDQCHV